ncbi:MAG: hypothetical protein E7Z86_03635 [Methanosphaera stadtmanae]|jgi:hypothetical protein|nr:hypothetical protein [Methanosphaera stadtmanae]
MTVIGPDTAAGICYCIGINGHDNYFENCNLYYKGTGITTAFGGSAYNNTFVGITFHNGTGFNAVTDSTITLKATLTDNNKVINSGKVVFKINGKTLKDAKGRTIYAKITDNIATAEYTLPDTFKANDYKITATLISSAYDRLEDNKTLSVTE